MPRNKVLDDRTSAEEPELLEKKQAMKVLLKEGRKTKVEGWRRHSCSWWWDHSGGSSLVSKLRSGGWSLRVRDGSSSRIDTVEGQKSFGHVKAQKRRAVVRKVSEETQDCVSALPLKSPGTEY